MSDWIETAKELPPCDGTYWVANNIETGTHEERMRYDETLAEYDGIGFIIKCFEPRVYRYAYYWKPYTPLEKRYGKVE